MNRLEAIREERGLSRAQLAAMVGTTYQTIHRLESGAIQMTAEWMEKLASALNCDAVDLLVSSSLAGARPDVEPATADGLPSLVDAIGLRGLRLYKVLSDVLTDAGIRQGDIVTVDETQEHIEKRVAGDIVLVRVLSLGVLLLRQYLPPHLLTTNRAGTTNSCLKTNDRTLRVSIVGILLRGK